VDSVDGDVSRAFEMEPLTLTQAVMQVREGRVE
jgi:hypothetical protein